MASMIEERLNECRQSYKLNVGYAGMQQLPQGFVELVRKSNPHITELELSSNNLTDLPDDISQLQQIRVLRLKYNQFKRVPSTITRLPQLMVLELSGNQVIRLDSNIAKLTSLKELDLSGNLLVELPNALATLPKLEVLRLENNRLESLPDTIGELPSLTKLDVSTNCLRQLPASMGRLKRIQRIDAANNMLVRVPPAMGHLKTIKELNLRYNNLDDKYKAKAEEGLSRLLAFLREEEERERLEEVERLRPIGTAVGPYMEYRCKAEPSQLLKTEFGDFTVDNRCWARTGFSLTQARSGVKEARCRQRNHRVQVNNMVYVFGGQLVKDGSVSNELFWMTSERMEWHAQPTRGDRPAGRHGHVAVYDPDHHQLVVFGGRGTDKKRLGDVAVLDLDSFTWRRPAISGTAPSPRELVSAVYHAGHMLVFAGHATGGRTNDLLMLELSAWSWSQPSTSGTAPSPRSGAALALGNGHYLVIHGGRNNFVLDDMHVLDLLTRTWIEVLPSGVLPPPRHGHNLHVHNEVLYLFGGCNELGAATVTLFKALLPRQALDKANAQHAAATVAPSGSTDGIGPTAAAPGADGALHIEWLELDAELPYNKNRAGIMHQGQLRCYQLGSATLGRSINDNDAEKGMVYWDVFKAAKLDAFKLKPVAASAEGEAAGATSLRAVGGSTKSSRVQHTTHSAGKLPPTFTSNNLKEQKMLAYIADFQRIFQELYPYRRPMPLTPLNECGVPKFICTTLRPSLPPFPQLYTLDGCAKFVSEFLTYEPLEDPLHPPSHLPSPMSVLQWQAGDAFDAAVVLSSLLLGAGFNAFVVMGYAELAATLNDQSRTECPYLNSSNSSCCGSAGQAGKQQQFTGNGTITALIAVRETPEPGSEASRLVDEAAGTELASLADSKQGARKPANNRVHAWVLVLPGRRDVTEAVFVEPATGQQIRPSSPCCPYTGVELVWNSSNAWICMQAPQPHSDARAVPGSISWDLFNTCLWEAVLEERQTRPQRAEPPPDMSRLNAAAGPAAMMASRPGLGSTMNASMMMTSMLGGRPRTPSTINMPRTPMVTSGASTLGNGAPGTPGAGSAGGIAASISRGSARVPLLGTAAAGASGFSTTGAVPQTPAGPERGTTAGAADSSVSATGLPGGPPGTPSRQGPPSEYARSECARSEVNEGSSVVMGEDPAGPEHDLLPDLPPSWVPKLSIPADMLDMRCPRGCRTTVYSRCTHEIFAGYGECARWDGLVERLTRYVDDARHVVLEVRETFARRKDKLRERRSYPQQDAVQEFFAPGSLFAVKDLHVVRGERRTINFYSVARLDGLVRREEVLGVKLTESFEGRDDRLQCRSATFSSAGAGALAAAVSERFGRNAEKPADQDIAKRVFYFSEGKTALNYHHGEGRLSCGCLVFHKDGQAQAVQVDPLAPKPLVRELLETYRSLQLAEKEVLQAVRDSEWEGREICRTRSNQEQTIVLEAPYHDICRIQADDSDEEPADSESVAYDYLLPFLPPGTTSTNNPQGSSDIGKMTREQALATRERCLRALKDRLIERANIIQARLDEEQSALSRRQASYARDRDALTPAEEEEYEHAVDDASFKISILQRRLARHEESALQKYYELDKKLRTDPRLLMLLVPV
eukprot:gene13287-13418_t